MIALAMLCLAAPVPPEALDFDLLDAPAAAAHPDEAALHRRRTLLNVHQAAGLGLVAMELTTTVLGQLNDYDLFHREQPTYRYNDLHGLFARATAVLFVGTGALALLAPAPIREPRSLDRTTVHRIAMAAATAGMATEVVLGPIAGQDSAHRARWSGLHLAVGYATLAALSTGVGALVL